METLRGVKKGDHDLEKARTVACLANSICNTVRTEIKVSEYNKTKTSDQEEIKF